MSSKVDYYIVQENKVIIEGTVIAFEYPIVQSIEIGNMLIVYIDLFDKVIPIEKNVFGISLSEKRIKWQVDKREYPNGGYVQMRCPFVGISFIDNGLWLHNWCSTDLLVEPTTGKVMSTKETR